MLYLSFSFWLTSLSMIISRSIHAAASGIISFLWLLFHCLYMYHDFFIQSSVNGHLGYFHVFIINNAAMNIGVCVSFWIMVLSRYMPRSGVPTTFLLMPSYLFSWVCSSRHDKKANSPWKSSWTGNEGGGDQFEELWVPRRHHIPLRGYLRMRQQLLSFSFNACALFFQTVKKLLGPKLVVLTLLTKILFLTKLSLSSNEFFSESESCSVMSDSLQPHGL